MVKGTQNADAKFWNKNEWGNYAKEHIIPLFINATSLTDVPIRSWAELRRYLKPRPNPEKMVWFINHTKVILKQIDKALELFIVNGLIGKDEVAEARKRSQEITKECIKDYNRLLHTLVNFLNYSMRITINTNEFTRFIWEIRKNIYAFLIQFHPELEEESCRVMLGLLGLQKYFEPPLPDEDIRINYSIYAYDHATKCYLTSTPNLYFDEAHFTTAKYYVIGYSDGPQKESAYLTLGGCLCRLNELVWRLFREIEFLSCFTEEAPPNLLEEWAEIAREILAQEGWEEPNELHFWRPARAAHEWAIIDLASYDGVFLLEDIAPALCLGKYELAVLNTKAYIVKRW